MRDPTTIHWRRATPDDQWDVRFGMVREPERGWAPLYVVYGEPSDDQFDRGWFYPGRYATCGTKAEAEEALTKSNANPGTHWHDNAPDKFHMDLVLPISTEKVDWVVAAAELAGASPARVRKSYIEKSEVWPTDRVAMALSVSFRGDVQSLIKELGSGDRSTPIIRVEGPDLPFLRDEWKMRIRSFCERFHFKSKGDLAF